MSMARVLVVDDDALSLQLLEVILKRDQHTVLTSADSTAVMDMAHQHQPDLIILNDNMPFKSGGDVCREIKAHPTLQNIPIILTSAGLRLHDPAYVRYTCADDVLLKPCLPADVRGIVNRHLQG